MLELHLARCLHKSFNSSNILFFGLEGLKDKSAKDWMSRIDLTQPYIASFGTAQPDSSFEQSEPACAAAMSEEESMYRHPVYVARTAATDQSQGRGSSVGGRRMLQPRYHRAFDVYSLGCVLLEIFTWTPLRSLGWSARTHANNPKAWRESLEKAAKKNVLFYAGPLATEIVVWCLAASADPDCAEGGDLEAFCWEVLEKLDQVCV